MNMQIVDSIKKLLESENIKYLGSMCVDIKTCIYIYTYQKQTIFLEQYYQTNRFVAI